jgi:outer membrane protein TolC
MRSLGSLVLVLCVVGSPVRADEPMPETLRKLLARIEPGNRELAAQDARVRAARELPLTLEALPDPKLSVAYTNDTLDDLTLGSSEFSNVTVEWEQDVPPARVREAAAAFARAEAEVQARSADTLRAGLRARVITLYADLYRLDRTTELVREIRNVLETELAGTRARYESGQGLQEALLRVQVELARLDLELEDNRRERRAVEIDLAETLGEAEVSVENVTSLPDGAPPSVLEPAAEAPAIRKAEAEALRAESAVERARTSTRPEYSWVAAYQFRGGLDPMIMGGFGVRLPVWKDRKQAREIRRAEIELEAARQDAGVASLRARAQLLSRVNDIDSADRRLVLYDEAIVPQDIGALEAARAALAAGRADMTLVLDGTRRLLLDRKEAVALRAFRIQTLASIEQITGLTLIPGNTP